MGSEVNLQGYATVKKNINLDSHLKIHKIFYFTTSSNILNWHYFNYQSNDLLVKDKINILFIN